MRYLILLLCLVLAGCVPGRTVFLVSKEVQGVQMAAYYELGGNQSANRVAMNR